MNVFVGMANVKTTAAHLHLKFLIKPLGFYPNQRPSETVEVHTYTKG